MTASPRLRSLDAFRGLAIAGMIVVNTPGDATHSYSTLAHAPWNGLTFADLVFPAFLFIVGTSMAFAFARDAERRTAPASLYLRIARRVLLLVALGLVVNGFPHYDLATLRWPGVLQRIALAYLVASLLVLNLPRWGQWVAAALLLGAYWWVMTHVSVPGRGPGILTPYGNLAGWIDRHLFAPVHLYRGGTVGYDPEGLLSTAPAVVTVLAGYWAGAWIRRRPIASITTVGLLAAAVLCLAVAKAWDGSFAVNKRIWSPSFTAATAGTSLLALAALYQLVEVWGRWRVMWPFEVMGMNAIVAYVGAELLAGTLQQIDHGAVSFYDHAYRHWFLPPFGAYRGSLAFALAFVLVVWIVLVGMWRARVFVKV